MVIGERLKVLREQRNLSQGDVEKRTGLLRCYVSRVESGQQFQRAYSGKDGPCVANSDVPAFH